MDLQGEIAKALAKLHAGLSQIAAELLHEALAKALAQAVVEKAAGRSRHKKKPRPQQISSDFQVGSRWIRRDGKTARRVLAVNATHVTIESPAAKNGRPVRRDEFTKRYRPA